MSRGQTPAMRRGLFITCNDLHPERAKEMRLMPDGPISAMALLPAGSIPPGTKGLQVHLHNFFTLASEHLSDSILQGRERHRNE